MLSTLSQFQRRIVYLSLGLLLVALMVLFGIFDLDISLAVVNEESGAGLWLELFGTLVAPWIFCTACLLTFVYCKRSLLVHARLAKMIFSILGIIGGTAYSITIYVDAGPRDGIIFAAVNLLLILTFSIIFTRLNIASLRKLCYIAVVAILYCVLVLAVINLLKVCWGRVRFRELTDLAEFSPWFMPQGINGHRSFPSGHTANASTLYILALFAPLCKRPYAKTLCYAIPIIWIVVMAVSRVCVGAHYASDVLFGALVSIALFYISKKLILAIYKHAATKKQAAAAAATAAT